jgi:arabinofuranosyltransferase
VTAAAASAASPAGPPTGSARALARGATVALVAVPFLILAIGAWRYRWMSDDGFINLRIVRQLLDGNGPVFNAGERVEASTSPLWLYLLSLEDLLLPLRLEWIAVLSGMALTFVGAATTVVGALRLSPRRADRATPVVWFPAGLLVVVAIAPSWKFASSGLENGLTVAWIGGCFLVLATWARAARPLRLPAAVLLGLGPLVRPELTLLSIALVGVVLACEWRATGWRRRLAIVAVAFALPVAYQVFRMGYYASLVPNSGIAKEASRAYWSSGWAYLRGAISPYWLWVPLVILVVGAYAPLVVALRRAAAHRALVVTLTFAIAAVVDAVYVVRVGGDFMRARLLLPALWMLLAPVAVVPLTRRYAGALLVAPWALVAILGLRTADDAPVAFLFSPRNAVTTEDLGFPAHGRPPWFSGHGAYYNARLLPGRASPHDPVVAEYGVGAIGYALGSDTYVLDLLGLGDAFTSHLELARRGLVAHEKPLPGPWIPARLLAPGAPVTAADVRVPELFFARPIDDPAGQPFATRVRDARLALHCGDLRTFLARTRGPLTAARFVENIFAAPAATRFRIPPEPRDAVARFCPSTRR